MSNQNPVNMMKKLVGFTVGVLMLPAFAACGTNQQTTEVPPTTTAPPVADVTPVPAPTAASPVPPISGVTTNENIKDVVGDNPSLGTFANLIDEADLENILEGSGPLTLFAPSDQAFAAIPQATRQRLLQPQNRQLLRQILNYHIVPGNLTANQLQSGEIQTLAQNPVNVQVNQTANQIRVNDATVTQPNIQARNGIVHVVDRVILPPTIQKQLAN
ncbi:MAG: fasciclin domain-containing protein [Scytonematopsis contorta HA4267-MV1]|jgi:uncharacterized surface protein with fasciclin (FAS1) repeats|nr:fasciclin domain-containing protein [Scytonematopsis contorta HA4267-MV1]